MANKKKKIDPFSLLCVEATALLDQEDNTDSKCCLLVKSKSDKRDITVLFGRNVT